MRCRVCHRKCVRQRLLLMSHQTIVALGLPLIAYVYLFITDTVRLIAFDFSSSYHRRNRETNVTKLTTNFSLQSVSVWSKVHKGVYCEWCSSKRKIEERKNTKSERRWKKNQRNVKAYAYTNCRKPLMPTRDIGSVLVCLNRMWIEQLKPPPTRVSMHASLRDTTHFFNNKKNTFFFFFSFRQSKNKDLELNHERMCNCNDELWKLLFIATLYLMCI